MTTTSATSVTSGGVLTLGTVANIMAGQTVQLTGTAFGGLVANSTYYIKAVGASTITLSLTSTGPAISILGGSGSMTAITGPRIGPGVGNIVSKGSTTVTDPTYGDYNTIQAIIAKVMGPPTNGDPRYGYNQTIASSQVIAGQKITLSHWINLREDMVKARGHQTGSASESNNITLPTDTSKITEALRLEYLNYANTILTYRDSIGGGQTTPDGVSDSRRIDDWNGNIVSNVTMSFGDAPSARAFFNAGGDVKFTISITTPFSFASQTKDNTWKTMFAGMGTITMDRTTTTIAAGSTGTTSNIGFFGLTSTPQQIFRKQAATGNYTNNEFKILASTDGQTVTFSLQYNDLDVGLLDDFGNVRTNNGYRIDEVVDGFISQTVAISRPSGYVSVPKPGVSQQGDFQNYSSGVYGLVADNYLVNEGSQVTVTLRTQNILDGTTVPYTVSEQNSSRFSQGTMTGFFQVYGGVATQSWTLANNLFTDGVTYFTVALNNGLALTRIQIVDTSLTPVGNQKFANTGQQYWTAPPGVRSVSVLMIGGGGGGRSFAGGGGGGGQVRIYSTATNPGQTYSVYVGAGGQAQQNGVATSFAGNQAFGGNTGTDGNTSGHGGTHTGGQGGNSGTGTLGGAGGVGTGIYNGIGGGGGGGSGGAGAAGGSAVGGQGGVGQMVTFLGENIFCGGGGGGGSNAYGGGAAFGAGAGNIGTATGNAGLSNTGGGGGGGGANYEGTQMGGQLVGYQGGGGGSGLIWISWP